MPIDINGSGTITGLSVGGLEDGIITPSELSTGAPTWDSQGNVSNITSINSGPLAGFRNAIINGNFDIWQRGTSFSNPASLAYTADRWRVLFSGTGATRTITREAFTLGQTDVPGEPTYFLKWNQTVAGTGATSNDLRQNIEDVRSFAGQQVTTSFYARAASAATLPTIFLAQGFGTGGSPSSAVNNVITTNVAVTTSWQRFSYTFTLPSISGKTLGSDNNDSLVLVIRMPLNATFNIDIAQVQVEAGPVATPFERRPLGAELALCQRYYQVTRGNSLVSSAQNVSLPVPFFVQMRGTPSGSLSGGSQSNVTSDVIETLESSGARYTVTYSGAGFSVGRIIRLDAEL